MKQQKTFGTFFKELRQRKGLSLRQFCQDNGLDPGNVSKIERDILPAPTSDEKLEEYAKALGVKRSSDDWLNFCDLAAVSRRVIKLDEVKSEALMAKLPVLFRTLDNKDLTAEKLDKIIEIIKKA